MFQQLMQIKNQMCKYVQIILGFNTYFRVVDSLLSNSEIDNKYNIQYIISSLSAKEARKYISPDIKLPFESEKLFHKAILSVNEVIFYL